MVADIPSIFFKISEEILNSIRGASYTVLIDDKFREGWIRTGIGRSYYAAFLVARKFLGLEYLTSSEVHRKVIEELNTIDSSLAYKLKTLRDLRNDADYDMVKRSNEKDLEYAVILSKNVIEQIISRSR